VHILESVLSCTPPGARPVGRVILLDPHDRVLLLLAGQPGDAHTWWITPGGGLESEETFEAAAAREASEETGLDISIGPCVWTRHHVFEWQGRVGNQYERFFVARSNQSQVTPRKQDSYVRGHRWWTLAEILRSTDDFAPARLGELLADILRGVYPCEPIDAGV
jgi:8-oxo-dGTP pyrophosphatase MutT (NUDIX family)